MLRILILHSSQGVGENILASLHKCTKKPLDAQCVLAATCPTLEFCQKFNVVLFESINSSSYNAKQVGDLLANLSDQGIGIVVTVLSACSSISQRVGGRFEQEHYHPCLYQSYETQGQLQLGQVFEPQHALLNKVVNLYHAEGSSFSNAKIDSAGGAVLVANWSTGLPLVAYKQKTKGRVVFVNLYATNQLYAPYSWSVTSDSQWLFYNAVLFAAHLDKKQHWNWNWKISCFQDVTVIV